jgi:hypothetical protein
MGIRNTRKTISISPDSHERLCAYGEPKLTVENLILWLPVYDVCEKLGLSIEQASERLVQVSPTIPTNRIPKSSRNRDEFSKWLEKLIAHNETSTIEDRVYLTQRLFLNLIGGNVNTISDAFRQQATLIDEHNKKMQTDESSNRKLSHKVREKYGTVADWLKKILA